MSMPPIVKWRYDWQPELAAPEAPPALHRLPGALGTGPEAPAPGHHPASADESPLVAPAAPRPSLARHRQRVLILAWFVSGLVMLYIAFPKLDTGRRVARLAALQPDSPASP